MNEPGAVLVTGLSGLIGTALRERLQDEYALSALNRSAVAGIPTTQASIGDYDAMRPAFTGKDTVVHLAACIHDGYGWDKLHEVNVVGTRNVLEAAVAAGVKRVVFTSSGATVAGWEKVAPYYALVAGDEQAIEGLPLITEGEATRPANLYAATKVWGEALARHYADNHGLEVVCLRIGYASEADRPLDARQMSVWNSQADVVHAIQLAMTVDLPENFNVCFILSDNRFGYRSLAHAGRLLGFRPQDSADRYSLEP